MEKMPPNKTLARGLDVLELVVHAPSPMRLTDVASSMSISMPSAYRVLRTLELSGYLKRDTSKRCYRPGHKVWTLAQCLPSLADTLATFHPLLAELSEQTGQVAHVGLLQNSRVILTDIALTSSAKVTVSQAVGDTEEIYCSAIGKSLAAFAPTREQATMISTQSFQRCTEFTITDAQSLTKELAEVRRTGLAFDDREGSLDVSCIAAPVCDPMGYAPAAIGISSVAARLNTSIRAQHQWIDAVSACAARAKKILAEEFS